MRDFEYRFTIQGTLVIPEESREEAEAFINEYIRKTYPFGPESGKITDSYSVAVNAVQITFSEEREESDGDEEGKALEDILDVRGTAATNGDLWIERSAAGFGGGYKVRGTSFQEFPSWDSLIKWAKENKVDLSSGWRPLEPGEDDDDE